MGILRVILAISVIIAHSSSFFGLKITGGIVAVEVFFIISGFYMSMILDKKYIGKGSYYLFLSNRLLRLYPIYWAVLVLTLIAAIISCVGNGDWHTGMLSPYASYFDAMSVETVFFQLFTNLFLFGQDVVMFMGFNPENGSMFFISNFRDAEPQFFRFLLVPQAWTLGIELMFYLIAPFVVRRSTWTIICLVMLSMAVRLYTYIVLGYSFDPWTYRFFPSELALFLLGTLSYRIYNHLLTADYDEGLYYPVVGVFFTILVFFQFIPCNHGYIAHAIRWGLYLFACLTVPLIFKLSKGSKFDNRIGELSYPMYVSHVLVIYVISPLVSKLNLHNYMGEISVLCVTAVSYLLVTSISDRVENIRQLRLKSADSA